MRKSIFILWVSISLVLAGCKPANQISEGVLDANPAPHFFEVLSDTPSEKNRESDSAAKAVPTNTPIVYPTPLPTFLVKSILVTAAPQVTVSPSATAIKTQAPTTIPTLAATNTQAPVSTATKTASPIPSSPTPTSTSTAVAMMFAPQSGTPVEIQNFVNTTAGCNWQGIAGQVFDKDDTPLKNIVIRAGGTWNGLPVNLVGVSGAATTYGEGGFELVLGTKTALTTKTVWVQLYDLQSKPLSDKVYINTSTTCSKNLILLNFKFIAEGYESYIPLILQ